MAIQEIALSLNPADGTGPTLSGGARYATASGSLPARVTTEAETNVQLGTHYNQTHEGGFRWDSDNDYIWIGGRNPAVQTSKIRVSDGAITPVVGTYNKASYLTRPEGDYIYAHETLNGASNKIHQIRRSDATITASVTSGYTGNPRCFELVPGTNLAWIAEGFASITEINVSTGALTGRTISAQGNYAVAISLDGLYLYAADTTSDALNKYRLSDLAVMWTSPKLGVQYRNEETGGYIGIGGITNAGEVFGMSISPTSGNIYIAGSCGFFEMDDSDGSLVGFVSMFSPVVNEGLTTAANGRFGGMLMETHSGGEYVGIHTWEGETLGYPVQPNGFRRIRITDQETSWTVASSGVLRTLRCVSIPGHFATMLGLNDFRRVRFYYDVGSGWVEFTPGALIGATLPAGESLLIKAVIHTPFGQPPGPPPFIGAVEIGEANQVTVYIDDPSATDYIPVPVDRIEGTIQDITRLEGTITL